ncbi:uncharacterized protein LOC135847991 [Planococcus citri]|uniref:uncharacterized protein LOC135847991 n=1 Tax=Planococcus citri TaxID=170843 RepID=UPI0031F9664B
MKSYSIKHCQECNKDIDLNKYLGHLKSLEHKNNCRFRTLNAKIEEIKSAFKNRIKTYRITPNESYYDITECLSGLRPEVEDILAETAGKLSSFKYNLELFAKYYKPIEMSDVKSFNTKNIIYCAESGDLEGAYQQFENMIKTKSEEFQSKGSGWSLEKILFLEVNINKYKPIGGSSYIPLPKWLANKKAIINIQNEDQACFAWAVISALYPREHFEHPYRTSSYPDYKEVLKFDGIEFPMKLSDIKKFEKINPLISINVFGVEGETVVGPLYFSGNYAPNQVHINLLYIQNEKGSGHYCWIKNLSRLVSSQLNKVKNQKYICNGCLINFNSLEKLKKHEKNDCNHIVSVLPEGEKAKINFKNVHKMLRVPFVIYADFEAYLKPFSSCSPDPTISHTENVSLHEPFSFACYTKCSFDSKLDRYFLYRGSDCVKQFWTYLQEEARRAHTYFSKTIPMKPLTPEQKKHFRDSTECYICEKKYIDGEIKVRDHDHFTGIYRNSAHQNCNINLKRSNFVPVILHNLSNYDAHFIIPEIGCDKSKVDLIANTKEKYISFTKYIGIDCIDSQGGVKKESIKLRFLDSYRFLPASLDSLVKNLPPTQLKTLASHFQDQEEFQLMNLKGVFPYEFTDCEEKLKLEHLPSKDDFYSKLTKSGVTDEEYKRAGEIWKKFNCKNLGEYSDLYLKTDVLLLTDVFENFRDLCLDTYKLDPAHYFTSPGLSWDAMLKYTKITLDLLTDIDMVHFIKKGIRGGLSQCSKRKAIANNTFMRNFDPSKPSHYLVYLDCNNLYGHSLSSYLGHSEFEWVEKVRNFNVFEVNDDSETGYILEVDLEYPQELHDFHRDFPFCPESMIPPGAESKQPKLIANVLNKKNYIIHYSNLKQCLTHGLKLSKIHRILKFRQSRWLKPYIDLNTSKRAQAKTEFEKDFWKLMNNSVFGKTMESVEKRIDVRLATQFESNKQKRGAQYYINLPQFHSCTIFNENLVAIELNKVKIVYDKPIYIGFSVLDSSKLLMYNFHYNVIKPLYNDKVELCYTDTDSLLYDITTYNFYADILPLVPTHFDTSDYPKENIYNFPLVNKKVIGKFKDECNGKIMYEFIGLKSKSYCFKVEDKVTKKCKGIKKCVVKEDIKMDEFKTCLENKTTIFKPMYNFRTNKHVMYTQLLNKKALSFADDKRFLLPNGIETLPWGHYRISKYQ